MTTAIIDLIKHWKSHPVDFVRTVLQAEPQDWQANALNAIASNDRVAIKSGKGVGKSSLLAWIILWFLATRPGAKVACTANSANQLEDVLWSEIRKWIRQMEFKQYLPFEVSSDRVTLVDGFARARTARKDNPEALQGLHDDNMLFLADEASGIDEIIFQAAEGAMSTKGAKTVLTGNPTRTRGYFFDAFHKDASRWVGITVDCNNSPMVTREYIDYMASKWGVDSNEYRIGVMGEFPLGDANGVIPLYMIERAIGRKDVQPHGEEVWGLDVARMGDDRCALVKRRGNVIMERPQTWGQVTLDVTADRVFDEYVEARVKPVQIVVDAIGVGAGVADMLRRRGLPVVALNVAEVASSKKAYHRKRDELWFRARDWFETMNVSIPVGCDDMVEELAAVEYEIAPGGQRRILNKKALGWSPDQGDAFCLTFSYRNAASDPIYNIRRMEAEVVCDAVYMEYYN
jgi:phage terminase large subunit